MHNNQHKDSITYLTDAFTDKFIYDSTFVIYAKVIEAMYIATINIETPRNGKYIKYLLPSKTWKSVINPKKSLKAATSPKGQGLF